MPIAPYGSWRSPIGASLVATGGIRLDSLHVDGDDLYWLEGRPTEGGRNVIVRNGSDVTPAGFNVRTRVHEYGGAAYTVHRGAVYFSNFADQRLYRDTTPITPGDGASYADIVPLNRTLIAVRQVDEVNDLVAIPIDGSTAPARIAAGHDFYASPRISPDGTQLAWLTWDHPNMPWDGADLWLAGIDGTDLRHIAGGQGESIFQPEWSSAGVLHYVSDRTGWWNIAGTPPVEAEFGRAQWVFGQSTYTFLPDGRIAAVYSKDGLDYLAILENGAWRTIELPFTAFDPPQIVTWGPRLAFIAASPIEPASVVVYDPTSGHTEILKHSFRIGPALPNSSRAGVPNPGSGAGVPACQEPPGSSAPGSAALDASGLDPASISYPRIITFPTDGGQSAYAIFYPPSHRDFHAPAGEKPPLIVMSHGGPTSQAFARFIPAIQFWTSRGFAVVDVNYGGSTGYGRAYRERLNGQWGIVDTQDCIAAARYLARQGEVDGQRLAIRGGSAGGYTTLCALVFHDDFKAGASYYGVAELESLATDTHKFESRYLDRLVGPYPDRQDLYRARSPIHFAGQISCPVILFQGLDDKVVPPAQAEIFVQALKATHLPYAYLTFEGEQHGFRQAETIRRTLEAELYFYSRIFAFDLPDQPEHITIENLE